jgi:hypothetical protein
MRKLATLLVATGLVLVMPSSAGGSSLQYWGSCAVTKDGRVGLHASVMGYEYDTSGPVQWIYRARRVDSSSWFHAGGYTEILDVAPETLTPISGAGNFTSETYTRRQSVQDMVIRVDLLAAGRHNRVAYFNDRTMDPEECRPAR